jgi:hypothetical protein
MRFRDEIINHLRGRLGTSADPADIIDELYGCGAIDERSARTFVAYNEFVKRYQSDTRSPSAVMTEVAQDLDVDRVTVLRIVQRTHIVR